MNLSCSTCGLLFLCSSTNHHSKRPMPAESVTSWQAFESCSSAPPKPSLLQAQDKPTVTGLSSEGRCAYSQPSWWPCSEAAALGQRLSSTQGTRAGHSILDAIEQMPSKGGECLPPRQSPCCPCCSPGCCPPVCRPPTQRDPQSPQRTRAPGKGPVPRQGE